MKLTTIKNIPKIKSDIEKNILPPKPKKPLNPYFLYFQSVRNKLQQEHPGIKYIELIKKVSQEWAKIDPTIKQKFQKQHDENYTVYKQKLDHYNNSITDDQRMLIIEELMKKKGVLEKNQTKQKLMELGKPKRPLSAYLIFLRNKKDSKDPKIPQKEWIKNLSNEWNKMTTEDKDKYYTEAKELQEKYNTDLKKWEQNMIQMGHFDLLRSNTKSKSNKSVNKYEE
ncbi:transcription factor A, mitochondrial isoform X2 [Harpegnathos saltator]|uniref:transcription factor A, mitochondrial isoform X2 n=1 Tax=Harpegnathos saltator TaxID=610380 RepID=UPI000DBEEE2C|nr:transcription factor A, mitochondrial isoform X2 [Harpegnathos saltator]